MGVKQMTVKDLIELLKQYDEDLPVAYNKWSERCLLEASDLTVIKACYPREDGWIQNDRPDMFNQEYLCFDI